MANMKERFDYADVSKFAAAPVVPKPNRAAATALDRTLARTIQGYKKALSALGKPYEGTTKYALEVRVLSGDKVWARASEHRSLDLGTKAGKRHDNNIAPESGAISKFVA